MRLQENKSYGKVGIIYGKSEHLSSPVERKKMLNECNVVEVERKSTKNTRRGLVILDMTVRDKEVIWK